MKFTKNRGDLDKLCQFIDQKSLMVEIGSLAGISTEIFSKYFKNVTSIDPYIPDYDKDDINSSSRRLKEAQRLFKERFKNNSNVSQLKITSKQAALEHSDESLIDLVYIDACHTYKSVKQDILLWKDKCRYIGGHDWDWEGVRKAVTESFKKKEIIIFKPNHWLVKL